MDLDRSWTKSHKLFAAMMIFILTVTLFVSLVPQGDVRAVTCKFKHKVEQGETLIYIANLYGVDWEKIADANNLQPPYTVIEAQVLCIPEGTKPGNTSTTDDKNKTPPALQVVPGQNDLLLSVENFPKKTSYYVRIIPAHVNVSYRLGHFTTNKEGDFTDWFRVPYFVKRSPQMTLCVKNVWTDKTSCIKYDDIFSYYPFVRGKCSPKEGR